MCAHDRLRGNNSNRFACYAIGCAFGIEPYLTCACAGWGGRKLKVKIHVYYVYLGNQTTRNKWMFPQTAMKNISYVKEFNCHIGTTICFWLFGFPGNMNIDYIYTVYIHVCVQTTSHVRLSGIVLEERNIAVERCSRQSLHGRLALEHVQLLKHVQ